VKVCWNVSCLGRTDKFESYKENVFTFKQIVPRLSRMTC